MNTYYCPECGKVVKAYLLKVCNDCQQKRKDHIEALNNLNNDNYLDVSKRRDTRGMPVHKSTVIHKPIKEDEDDSVDNGA